MMTYTEKRLKFPPCGTTIRQALIISSPFEAHKTIRPRRGNHTVQPAPRGCGAPLSNSSGKERSETPTGKKEENDFKKKKKNELR